MGGLKGKGGWDTFKNNFIGYSINTETTSHDAHYTKSYTLLSLIQCIFAM